MITINIVWSLVVALPSFLLFNTNTGSCGTGEVDPMILLSFSWVDFFVTFLLHILAISFFYFRMVNKLEAFQSDILQNLSERQQLQRYRENDRMTFMLTCIIVVFILLVFPYHIFWILEHHDVWKKHLTINQRFIISWVVNTGYVIHACLNPFIYSAVDKRFRSNVAAIFTDVKKLYQRKDTKPHLEELIQRQ